MFLLSLPMRERGLKYHDVSEAWYRSWSLPMRERGLKYAIAGTREDE